MSLYNLSFSMLRPKQENVWQASKDLNPDQPGWSRVCQPLHQRPILQGTFQTAELGIKPKISLFKSNVLPLDNTVSFLQFAVGAFGAKGQSRTAVTELSVPHTSHYMTSAYVPFQAMVLNQASLMGTVKRETALAPVDGFEPPKQESESCVLPLD